MISEICFEFEMKYSYMSGKALMNGAQQQWVWGGMELNLN